MPGFAREVEAQELLADGGKLLLTRRGGQIASNFPGSHGLGEKSRLSVSSGQGTNHVPLFEASGAASVLGVSNRFVAVPHRLVRTGGQQPGQIIERLRQIGLAKN